MSVIEIDRTNTTAPAVAGRHNAFDVLGVDTSDQPDVTNVMAKANLLGWNVRLRGLETVDKTLSLEGVTDHERLRVKDHFAVIRDNPRGGFEEIIGVVGKKFVPTQNEELVDFMGALVDVIGAPVTRAADYYGNGKQVFFTIELPVDVLINGVDLVSHNLTIFTGHDGSLAVTPVISSVRVPCANQRNYAISKAASFTKIRHTKSVHEKIAATRTALGITLKIIEKANERADILANAPIKDEDFWAIVNQVWPLELGASTRMQTMHKRRDASLKSILHGPTNAGIDGSKWAALNTITEHLQHSGDNQVSNARKAMRSPELSKLADRAESLLLAV